MVSLLKKNRGISFSEAVVTMSILGIVALGMPKVIRFISNITSMSQHAQFSRVAQIRLFQMTREIRNAKRIVLVTPQKLEIQLYHKYPRFTEDISPIIDDSNLGTIIYEYKEEGGSRFLEKSVDFPEISAGLTPPLAKAINFKRQLFKDRILDASDPENFIFRQVVPSWGTNETTPVEIVLRLQGFKRHKIREFRAQALKRSRSYL